MLSTDGILGLLVVIGYVSGEWYSVLGALGNLASWWLLQFKEPPASKFVDLECPARS